jgi:hypothetical protein
MVLAVSWKARSPQKRANRRAGPQSRPSTANLQTKCWKVDDCTLELVANPVTDDSELEISSAARCDVLCRLLQNKKAKKGRKQKIIS